MRRRSQSILAENAEDFLKQDEQITKLIESPPTKTEEEDDYDSLGCGSQNISPIEINYFEEEDEEGSSEDFLGDTLNYSDEGKAEKIAEEEAIMILCNYLRNSSPRKQIKKENKNSPKIKKFSSASNIINLNIDEVISNIFDETFNSSEGTSSSTKTNLSLISNSSQMNFLYDEKIKILFVSNERYFTRNILSNFISESIEKEKANSEAKLNIYNKVIKLFNKKFSIECIETYKNFHKEKLSYVYYEIVNGFFLFIDFDYPYKKFMNEVISAFLASKEGKLKNIFLFSKNFKGTEASLHLQHNMIHIKMDNIKFQIENEVIKNTFSLLIIKKIHREPKEKSKTNFKPEKNQTEKEKFKLSPKPIFRKCYDELSSNENYRLCSINVFDLEDTKVKKTYNEI